MGAVLAGAYKGHFDLTVISHVERLTSRCTRPVVLLRLRLNRTGPAGEVQRHPGDAERRKLLGDIQPPANDSVKLLFQLPQFAVANKRLKACGAARPSRQRHAAVSWHEP